ncbi:DNA-binding response regulator, NarL/FixJ family, contains REC and HTH domains [Flavobacterium fluvii]|uniref:DNA-binding response regulator, NarL/FixJ family, contains REC and HTH domains n=1 Tax=Flavobacterium fluvii TaxID=468056 RepID=A0A1M5KYM0_9FLAO|nr:response regulator transcription factor [Flavobacterium fluvii]SHG57815.1 DNA-binding response regulator, NarL/FixJ family, contains REC and HTH domains [Flavobacterium fluvii]
MNILLVDDHPMTVEGFMNVLLKADFLKEKPVFTKKHSCEGAYIAITEAIQNGQLFDLAIIDQGLPSYPEQFLTSGSDLALLTRKRMPDCKIIMVTAHSEVITIYDIVKKVNPGGLINKNDINPDNLQLIVSEVMQGNQYHSLTVKNCINEIWKKELMFDDFNRQILSYLSIGFKVKELEDVVHLSTSAVQKRVIRMKTAFEVTDDSGLVKEAIKQGFI